MGFTWDLANRPPRQGGSYTLSGYLKSDCEREVLFSFSSPENLHTILVISPFPYIPVCPYYSVFKDLNNTLFGHTYLGGKAIKKTKRND